MYQHNKHIQKEKFQTKNQVNQQPQKKQTKANYTNTKKTKYIFVYLLILFK